MSDQSTHPDEPGREPDLGGTSEPVSGASADPVEPPADPGGAPQPDEATAEIPQRGPGGRGPGSWPAGAMPPGAMPRNFRQAARSRGMLAIATGVVGLMIGVLIGALGVVFVAAIARHVHEHHGPGFRPDDRGNYWRDDPPRRPFIQPGQVNPVLPGTPTSPPR
jgi:hypothetical protein